jgi:hypothetical protein
MNVGPAESYCWLVDLHLRAAAFAHLGKSILSTRWMVDYINR